MNHQNKSVGVEGILPKTETAVGSCQGSCRKEMGYAANCLLRANVNLVPSGWATSPVNRGDIRQTAGNAGVGSGTRLLRNLT